MADIEHIRVGVLGAGQMAGVLARGWAAAGLVAPEHGVASDPSPEARARFIERSGWKAVPSNRDVVIDSDVLVLAVKPQMVASVLADVRTLIAPTGPTAGVRQDLAPMSIALDRAAPRRYHLARRGSGTLRGGRGDGRCTGPSWALLQRR